MEKFLAELEAEEDAAQRKSSKALRKRSQKKGLPDTPSVSDHPLGPLCSSSSQQRRTPEMVL
jgi:hypothetical protein